jgi:DNA-binding MarR family transcriptional regulator
MDRRVEQKSIAHTSIKFHFLPTTTSTTVDELVNNQFVLREPSTEDRRKIALTLTDPSQQTLKEVFEHSRQHLTGYLSPLSTEESEIVFQALKLLGPLFSSRQYESMENT